MRAGDSLKLAQGREMESARISTGESYSEEATEYWMAEHEEHMRNELPSLTSQSSSADWQNYRA
eukprot:753371-Hanusia_phi.AAC.4